VSMERGLIAGLQGRGKNHYLLLARQQVRQEMKDSHD
jgi:hypothetical protein